MEKSSFFNSVNHDRIYSATDISNYFASLLTNGVLPATTNLQVMSNNNMTVTVKAGKAFINGYFYYNDSDLILPIASVDGVLNRIDRVVIQYNTISRNITVKIKKGVFASSPVATNLQRDADAFELGIGDIYISKGVASISQANITDLRLSTTYCGLINSLLQADTTSIFNQYQNWYTTQSNKYNAEMSASQLAFNTEIAETEVQFQSNFDSWFTTIQNQLSGDIAGNLAVSISNLAGNGRTTETVKQNAADIVTLGEGLASHSADVAPHGAVSVATAGKLIVRDASGRAKVSTPLATDDIARKAEVDTVQANLNTQMASYSLTMRDTDIPLGTDLLAWTEVGVRRLVGATYVNLPTGATGWGWLKTYRCVDWYMHEYVDIADSSCQTWVSVGAISASWRKVYNAYTDGAGSGLDADLLDGLDSTAFAKKATDFVSSLGTYGYQKLPSGLIMQWGQTTSAPGSAVTFPIAFPNACLNVSLGSINSMGTTTSSAVYALAKTQFTYYTSLGESSYYMAIGY